MKKLYLLTIIIIMSFNSYSESWSNDYYLETSARKECSSSVFDEFGNKFSITFMRFLNKRGIEVIFHPKKNILSKNEGLVADLSFIGENGVSTKNRVRFNHRSSKSRSYVLNSKNITKETFENILKKIRNQRELKIKVYDKSWVEHDYTFNLNNSNNIIVKTIEKCEK